MNAGSAVTRMPFIRRSSRKKRWISASKNTVLADYIWLPLRFDGEMAYIDWLDEWKLEDYE